MADEMLKKSGYPDVCVVCSTPFEQWNVGTVVQGIGRCHQQCVPAAETQARYRYSPPQPKSPPYPLPYPPPPPPLELAQLAQIVESLQRKLDQRKQDADGLLIRVDRLEDAARLTNKDLGELANIVLQQTSEAPKGGGECPSDCRFHGMKLHLVHKGWKERLAELTGALAPLYQALESLQYADMEKLMGMDRTMYMQLRHTLRHAENILRRENALPESVKGSLAEAAKAAGVPQESIPSPPQGDK